MTTSHFSTRNLKSNLPAHQNHAQILYLCGIPSKKGKPDWIEAATAGVIKPGKSVAPLP